MYDAWGQLRIRIQDFMVNEKDMTFWLDSINFPNNSTDCHARSGNSSLYSDEEEKNLQKTSWDWQTCKIYHLHLQHLLNSLCISFYFADLINCIIIIIHWKGHSCGLLIMNVSQYSQTRNLLSKTRTLPILCPYETSRTNNIVSRHEYWLDSVQYSKADNNLSSNWHYTSTSLTTST